MVEVSERFKELSLQSGRRVYCRIIAGGEEFLDDRLLEFSFDDVAHPDWFTVGTACSNRFHFIAKFSGSLAVNDEVRPYISFDGEEWCPLGVFYISRRYMRGDIINITAYDRMYSLDMEYTYTGTFPADSAALLSEICTVYGIDAEKYGQHFDITAIPEGCTVRDMIGYIAAMNGACAKLDRYGVLRLKKCGEAVFDLSSKNCMEIQRNIEPSVISAVKVELDNEILSAGEGAELSTVELYDPLMTESALNRLYAELKGFSFYGMEAQMQGLPFLEAGEAAVMREGGEAYNIVISEIEYYYNGGLTARLYSRNKTNVDALVREDDLEQALTQLKDALTAMSMKYVNGSRITLDTAAEIIAEFEFDAVTDAFAELHLNACVSGSTAGYLDLRIYINGNESGRQILCSPNNGEHSLVSVYHLEQGLTKGKNRIYVTACTDSGQAGIAAAGLLAGIVVHGAVAVKSGDIKDKVTLFENPKPVTAGPVTITLADITDTLSGYTETMTETEGE